MLAGLPCAGKSTAASALDAHDVGAEWIVLEADRVYNEVCGDSGLDSSISSPKAGDEGSAATAAAWHESRKALLAKASVKLSDGDHESSGSGKKVVCIDDTSEHRSWRRQAAAIARAHGASFLVVEFAITEELSLSRNAHRTAANRVPEASIRRIHEMLALTTATVERRRHASAWESAFLQRIDGTLPPREASTALAEAVASAWANKLPDSAKPAKAATGMSEVHSADEALRTLITAVMSQLRAWETSSSVAAVSSSSDPEAPPHPSTVAELVMARLQHCDDVRSRMRHAATLLAAAKREALAAARAHNPVTAASEACAESAISATCDRHRAAFSAFDRYLRGSE